MLHVLGEAGRAVDPGDLLALAACALWGVVVERVAVRPFVARGSNSWLIATVALGIVIDNVVLFMFGKDPRGMPPGVLTTGGFAVAGVRIQYIQALIPVIGLVVAAGLQALFVRRGTARRCSPSFRTRMPPG